MRKTICRWFGLITVEEHEKVVGSWRQTCSAIRALLPPSVVTISGVNVEVSFLEGNVVIIDGHYISLRDCYLNRPVIVTPDSRFIRLDRCYISKGEKKLKAVGDSSP